MPRGRRFASDRAPTIEEIRKIIEYPDRRIRCIVFAMANNDITTRHEFKRYYNHLLIVKVKNRRKTFSNPEYGYNFTKVTL